MVESWDLESVEFCDAGMAESCDVGMLESDDGGKTETCGGEWIAPFDVNDEALMMEDEFVARLDWKEDEKKESASVCGVCLFKTCESETSRRFHNLFQHGEDQKQMREQSYVEWKCE